MKNYKASNNINHNTMMKTDPSIMRRQTLGSMLESDHEDYSNRTSDAAASPSLPQPPSDNSSPMWDQSPRWSLTSTPLSVDISASPLSKSPWLSLIGSSSESYSGLMGSLVREEGHVYSLAASGDLLYTGSDSRNIRVWKNQKEFSGFKSSSGLVKAIIIAGERIFTGHQDGKIRVWKVSAKNYVHKRIGTLPTLKAKFKSSLKPSNYVEVRKKQNAIWIKHVDAISSLCLSEDKSLLYSASWDKMVKVWRLSDSKCLESINAHDDSVNSVVTGFDGLVFTGSADGYVKVWRRELQANKIKHILVQTLLKQEWAITSLAVEGSGSVLYCGSSDGLVNFWERHKFLSHGGVLRGHKLAVLCLATGGNLVFSGSADMNICVWKRDYKDGEHICLSVLSGHLGPVKCLAVEEEEEAYPNGVDRQFIVYSGSLDKSVKIWRVLGQTIATQFPPGPRSRPVENYALRHKFSSSYRQGTPPRTPLQQYGDQVENYNGLQKLHSSQSTRTPTQSSSKMSRWKY